MNSMKSKKNNIFIFENSKIFTKPKSRFGRYYIEYFETFIN